MNLFLLLAPSLVSGADKVPAPEDVKAGWVAFAVFIGLVLALAVLAFSLNRHLRRAGNNADAGAFDPSDPRRSRTS